MSVRPDKFFHEIFREIQPFLQTAVIEVLFQPQHSRHFYFHAVSARHFEIGVFARALADVTIRIRMPGSAVLFVFFVHGVVIIHRIRFSKQIFVRNQFRFFGIAAVFARIVLIEIRHEFRFFDKTELRHQKIDRGVVFPDHDHGFVRRFGKSAVRHVVLRQHVLPECFVGNVGCSGHFRYHRAEHGNHARKIFVFGSGLRKFVGIKLFDRRERTILRFQCFFRSSRLDVGENIIGKSLAVIIGNRMAIRGVHGVHIG